MSHPRGSSAAVKSAVQLIEAGVEAGFALVDQAHACQALGQMEFSGRIRAAAGEIIAELELRLNRLDEAEARPFQCLLTELRDELAALERDP